MSEDYLKERKLYKDLKSNPGSIARILIAVPGSGPFEFCYKVEDGELHCEVLSFGVSIEVPHHVWEERFLELCDQVEDGITTRKKK